MRLTSEPIPPPINSLRPKERVTIVSLSAAHFFNDGYSNFLGPLLPLLVTKLSLTIAQAGWLAAVSTISTSFTQPFYGYLSDRYRKVSFTIFGPLITAVFMSCIGLAPNFLVLATLLAFAGIGVASFHPQAAALVASVSSKHRGLGMSIFVSSGSFGFAVSPVFVTYAVTLLGLQRSYLIMIPGIIAVTILYFLIPKVVSSRSVPLKMSLRGSLGPVWRPLLILYLLVVLRSAVQMSFLNFLPLYFTQQGNDLIFGGKMAALFMFFGALGGLVGGAVSDRVGGRKIIIFSMLLTTPTLAAFLLSNGPIAMFWLALGGFILLCTLPVNVVMGQQLLPQRASMVSALMMGFAWGLAGMLVPVVGSLADHMGLGNALLALITLPIIGFVLSLFLPQELPSSPDVDHASG